MRLRKSVWVRVRVRAGVSVGLQVRIRVRVRVIGRVGVMVSVRGMVWFSEWVRFRLQLSVRKCFIVRVRCGIGLVLVYRLRIGYVLG